MDGRNSYLEFNTYNINEATIQIQISIFSPVYKKAVFKGKWFPEHWSVNGGRVPSNINKVKLDEIVLSFVSLFIQA